jgi:hypothetical protein
MIVRRMNRSHVSRLARLATLAAHTIALGVLAACATPLNGGARDSFVRVVTCAADHVSVVPRPDIKPPSSAGLSSSDDAAGPGGMGYWQQRRKSERRMSESPEDDCETFEVTGCDQRILFCCRHPWARDSTGVLVMRTDAVDCQRRSEGSAKSQGAAASPAPSAT